MPDLCSPGVEPLTVQQMRLYGARVVVVDARPPPAPLVQAGDAGVASVRPVPVGVSDAIDAIAAAGRLPGSDGVCVAMATGLRWPATLRELDGAPELVSLAVPGAL